MALAEELFPSLLGTDLLARAVTATTCYQKSERVSVSRSPSNSSRMHATRDSEGPGSFSISREGTDPDRHGERRLDPGQAAGL